MNSDIIKGVAIGLVKSSGTIVTASILVTYHITGHELTVSKVFRTLLYCTMVQDIGLSAIPRTVQGFGQAVKSLERIEVSTALTH